MVVGGRSPSVLTLASSVYITAMEPGSGRSVVSLGLMELLAARTQRIGFFRPIVADEEQRDPQIELIRRRYGLKASYQEMRGVSAVEAQAALDAGDEHGLEQRIVGAYRRLERRCDVIVCEGIDLTTARSALDFDLDVRLASQAGCPVLLVVRCADAPDVPPAVRRGLESLAEKGCERFGVIINRVAPSLLPEVAARLAAERFEPPVYALPESPVLAVPTVEEIASALSVRRRSASDERWHRDVRGITVATMGVARFLDDLTEGTLVVVSADRADILVASLVSALTADVPSVAGLALTGGRDVSPVVARLLDDAPFPVLRTPLGTPEAILAARTVTPALHADDERRLAAALGVFQASVDPFELERRIAVERPTRMTPAMLDHELLERAQERRQHVVLPEGDDDRVLRAADILLRRDVVQLTILGDPETVRTRADVLGVDVRSALVEDPLRSPQREAYAARYHELRRKKGMTEDVAFDTLGNVNYFGAMMVEQGAADAMVSGAAHTTADTVRPAFEIIGARPGVATVSSVFFMRLRNRVLVYGDCAINPKPDVTQLADIAISSAETALSFGIEPRLAMLSYSTGDSGKGADVDLVREATAHVRKRWKGLKVEGPIQYDAAVDADVARLKLPGSAVAGHATVFIFPDLEAGNIAYKAVQRSSQATAVGPILQGLRMPVNDLSRGCTVTDIVNTVVITAIQAQEALGSSTSRLRVKLPAH